MLARAQSLPEAKNDTGRTAFCGPVVLSAITGLPVSRVEEEIRRVRGLPEESERRIVGTTAEDVGAALAVLGYRMERVADYMPLERKARPTLWTWMQRRRDAWAHYILAIHKGREGHWILIKGVKLLDTFTDGRWTFVCDGPHKGARIMEVFAVKPAAEGQPLPTPRMSDITPRLCAAAA